MCCTIRCVLTLTCPGRPSHTKWSIQHQGVLFVCGASCSWAQDSSRNSLGCFVQYDSSNFFTPFVRHLVVWCARYDTYGFGYVSPSPKFSFDVACTILLLQLHTVGYAVYTRPNSVVIGTSTQYVDLMFYFCDKSTQVSTKYHGSIFALRTCSHDLFSITCAT